MRRALNAYFTREASTRTAALLRIGLVFLLWDRWAAEFLLYRMKTPVDLAIAGSFFTSTFLLAFGVFTRFASAWTAATMGTVFYYLGVVRGVESNTHHHTYLLVALSMLVALLPAGRSLSVDRWLAIRRGRDVPERGPSWALGLVALQVSVLYLFAAWDKTSEAFLTGERLQHVFLERYGNSDPVTIPYFAELAQASAVATTVIEYALGVGLWFRRVRLPLVVLGVVFHGLLFVALPVGPFSATMAVMYLAFFDPDAVHASIDRLLGRTPPVDESAAEPLSVSSG